MAVGTLAIGMVFIAGVFPVAIHYSTVATERTIGSLVADEAFAKVRMYGAVPGDEVKFDELEYDETIDFNDPDHDAFPATEHIDINEFAYPSDARDLSEKQYFWTAICRLTEEYHPQTNPNPPVQVTVFVHRRIGNKRFYWIRNEYDNLVTTDLPAAIRVEVQGTSYNNELIIRDNINDGINERTFINDGYTIVDDETGKIFRVVERIPPDLLKLDREWEGADLTDLEPDFVWVVPPPENGGRNTCIGVYQKIIRF